MAELHHRRGDGNAALLLDLHPVGGGGAGALALHLARLRDGTAVEQELLRQCSFSGVRMGNDGKCPTSGYFFL